MMIKTLDDLLEWLGIREDAEGLDLCDTLDMLGRALYDGTKCGAWISVQFNWTDWVFCSDVDRDDIEDLDRSSQLTRFAIGTIVEGSCAEQRKTFYLSAHEEELNDYIEYLEAWAADEWKLANESDDSTE